jgi:hypothetical protein
MANGFDFFGGFGQGPSFGQGPTAGGGGGQPGAPTGVPKPPQQPTTAGGVGGGGGFVQPPGQGGIDQSFLQQLTGGGRTAFGKALADRPFSLLGELLQGGPTQQQMGNIQALQQALFQQGAGQLQEQAQMLSKTLGSSAAARGLGQSSIGLGQQGLLGQQVLRQLGQLQQGLSAQGFQAALQLPFQTTAALDPLLGRREGRRLRQLELPYEKDIARIRAGGGGFGFGELAGAGVGSLLGGPFGGAAGAKIFGTATGGK